jgi:hypothetical protein
MLITKNFRLLLCSFLLITVSSCGVTSLTSTWQEPSFHRNQMDNVLVVAMTEDITNRILFERGFVKELSAKGIRATASFDVIGTDMPTKESVTAYVAKNNVNYVIMTRYDGTETTESYVPGSVIFYYSGFWGGAGDSGEVVSRAAFVDSTGDAVMTTEIYAVPSGKPLWVGRSKSFDLDSVSSDASDLAKSIIGSISD